MIPNRRKLYIAIAIYAMFGAAFGGAGYRWGRGPNQVTNLYFARGPEDPPDVELSYCLHSASSNIPLVTRNVALIRERTPDDAVQAAYFSPRRPDQWGSVEMEFRWDETLDPSIGILDPNLHLFGDYDQAAVCELALSSDATGNRWVTLVALGPSNSHFSIQHSVDVTPWVRGTNSLRIRYRMKASRLMYHPTPNDPIGLAAAQCLRSHSSQISTRLRLWKDSTVARPQSDG